MGGGCERGGGVLTTALADHRAEAARLAAGAAERGISLRIAGGVGIALRCPSATEEPLRRTYADIDAAGHSRQRRQIAEFLKASGYEADRTFNSLHGDTRLFFWDTANNRQLDIFLDRVEMCHRIDLADRLDTHPQTLSLADLLLMKLQIVETNHKDLVDIIGLLVDHPFTPNDTGIHIAYLSGLAANDWGLWRTTTMIAERVDRFARELEGFDSTARVHDQVRIYLDALETVPKSARWRLRAKVGERTRWYELPDEVR